MTGLWRVVRGSPTRSDERRRKGVRYVGMAHRTFEWDPIKAAANIQTHGVSFGEASMVFQDPLARMHGDPDHSQEEWRAIMVGHSGQDRLLVVSFVYRSYRSDRIRNISARAATRGERREYEETA